MGWRLATRLLGLAHTLILVRLLLPADFGLVALSITFAKAIDGLAALGVEDSLVRAHAPTRALYDTGFTVNLLSGSMSAAIIALLAWPAAEFFHEPRLTAVLLVYVCAMLISSAENIGIVDFRRDMTFQREFRLLLLPRLISIMVTVSLALTFHSYWALVAGSLTNQSLRVSMTYFMHPYRPRLSLSAWHELAHFSLWSWAINLMVLIRDRVDNVVIGRVMGEVPVGIFTIALEAATVPTYELAAPLGRAALSGFAAEKNAGEGGPEVYFRIIGTALLVGMPAGLGISLVADQVVHLAMGPRWLDAIEPVRILGFAGVGYLFGTVTSSMLAAHGRLRLIFIAYGLSVLVRLSLIIPLTVWYGLTGAAWGWAVAMSFEHAACVILAFRHFRFRWRDLAAHVWRPVLASAAMAIALSVAGVGWTALPPDGTGAALSLTVAIALGIATYGVVLLAVWLACGRPDGAETDLAGLIRRTLPAQLAAGKFVSH